VCDGSEDQPLERLIKILFAAAGLVGLAIGLVLFFLPGDAGVGSAAPPAPSAGDQWWPWPLRTELITRYIGAFVIGMSAALVWAATQRTWGQIRVLILLGLIAHSFVVVALLLHTESFESGDAATWLLFVLYPASVVAGAIIFARYEWLFPGRDRRAAPLE
jgi:hypothetical protein